MHGVHHELAGSGHGRERGEQPADDTSTVNLLGSNQLFPGTQLVLPVDCGTYDVVVTVAGGDQPPGAGMCVIRDRDVCASGTFVISSASCVLQ